MHTLRQRYGGNLIHTHAGPNMVVINPISAPSMYSEKVSQTLFVFPVKKICMNNILCHRNQRAKSKYFKESFFHAKQMDNYVKMM